MFSKATHYKGFDIYYDCWAIAEYEDSVLDVEEIPTLKHCDMESILELLLDKPDQKNESSDDEDESVEPVVSISPNVNDTQNEVSNDELIQTSENE